MTKNKLIDAYTSLRESNQSVPDDVLDFMYHAALQHSELKTQVEAQVNELQLQANNRLMLANEIFTLKAQVNAFIELQKEHYGDGMDTHLALIDLVAKTPEQCLTEYRSSVIDECMGVVLAQESIEFIADLLLELKK